MLSKVEYVTAISKTPRTKMTQKYTVSIDLDTATNTYRHTHTHKLSFAHKS